MTQLRYRATYGNDYHNSNPEPEVTSFFRDIHINKLSSKFDDAKRALDQLDPSSGEGEEGRSEAIKLGCVDAKKRKVFMFVVAHSIDAAPPRSRLPRYGDCGFFEAAGRAIASSLEIPRQTVRAHV